MTSLYWEVDPRDWDHPTGETDDAAHVERVIAEVRKAVEPGSIVLSHDFNQPDTISAYEKLLPWLDGELRARHPGQPPAPTPHRAPAARLAAGRRPGASPSADPTQRRRLAGRAPVEVAAGQRAAARSRVPQTRHGWPGRR